MAVHFRISTQYYQVYLWKNKKYAQNKLKQRYSLSKKNCQGVITFETPYIGNDCIWLSCSCLWREPGNWTLCHLLEGIELGIECIWVPVSSLEGEPGELNPGLTFLKALSLVLNTSGSLAAVWKGNWGLRALLNSPPISDKKRQNCFQIKCVFVPYEIKKNMIFLPGWTRPRASNFFNFSAFSRLTL